MDHATLPEQVVNSALRYQIAKPLVDAVMKDAGLANGNLTGISEALASMVRPNPKLEEIAKDSGDDRGRAAS